MAIVSQRLLVVAKAARWTVHDLYARLLVPALVEMRIEKSISYGAILHILKLIWRKEDWPDVDKQRSECLRALVQDSFLNSGESDLMTGIWLIAHLGIECFDS